MERNGGVVMDISSKTKLTPSNLQSHTHVCTHPLRKIEKTDERTDKAALANIKKMTNELKKSKIIQYFQHLPKAYLHHATNLG